MRTFLRSKIHKAAAPVVPQQIPVDSENRFLREP